MRRRELVALLAAGAIGVAPALAGEAGAPHAYYLFLAGAAPSCEDCYVPLLVTRQPLEDWASSGRDGAIVLITTYERDSISGRSSADSRSRPPTCRQATESFVSGADDIDIRKSPRWKSSDCSRSPRAPLRFIG